MIVRAASTSSHASSRVRTPFRSSSRPTNKAPLRAGFDAQGSDRRKYFLGGQPGGDEQRLSTARERGESVDLCPECLTSGEIPPLAQRSASLKRTLGRRVSATWSRGNTAAFLDWGSALHTLHRGRRLGACRLSSRSEPRMPARVNKRWTEPRKEVANMNNIRPKRTDLAR